MTMEYSYLPSWLSYLVDQDRARDAGRELFDAVYARWSELRPTPARACSSAGRASVCSARRPRSAGSST